MDAYTGPRLSSREVERLWRISIGRPPVMNDSYEWTLRHRGLVDGGDLPTLTDLGRAALADHDRKGQP